MLTQSDAAFERRERVSISEVLKCLVTGAAVTAAAQQVETNRCRPHHLAFWRKVQNK